MHELQETAIACPYCGESIDVLLDPSEAGQNYVEDCQVCCQPILFLLQQEASGDLWVEVRREDE